MTHVKNGRSVEVRINDRGPFVRGRIIDVSRAAMVIMGVIGIIVPLATLKGMLQTIAPNDRRVQELVGRPSDG